MRKKMDSQLWTKLPQTTGVYLFKTEDGEILYIGKALNIKKRVQQHFQGKEWDPRHRLIAKQITHVRCLKASSEVEALLLEANLIKHYQPKYNVRLKDDKRYLYVGISKEVYPKIFFFRSLDEAGPLLDWFGPFPSSNSIKEILRIVRKIFPYRTCSKLPKAFCLYYHLGLCQGMCEKSSESYSQTIKKLRVLLTGKTGPLMKSLEKEMEQASKELRFEEAQILKRQIEMLQRLSFSHVRFSEEDKSRVQLDKLRKILDRYQKVDLQLIHRLEAYDVARLGRILVGSMVVFIEGEPQNSLYRQFKIREYTGGDPQALSEVVARRLNHPEWVWPQVILVDGGKPQVSFIFNVLKQKGKVGKIALLGLAKEEEKLVIPVIEKSEIVGWKMLPYSKDNPAFHLLMHARDEAHRFAQKYYKLLSKRSFLPS